MYASLTFHEPILVVYSVLSERQPEVPILLMSGLDDQGLGRHRKGRLVTRKSDGLLGMGTPVKIFVSNVNIHQSASILIVR